MRYEVDRQNTPEPQRKLGTVIAKMCTGENFKKQLMSNAAATLNPETLEWR